MSPELNNVLQDVIKIVKYIKVPALNSRLFAQLCEEMDAECTRLRLYTEVRWLSKLDHWPEFLSYESRFRDFFQKNSHHWQHISVTQNGSQNLLTFVTYSACSINSICHFRGERQLCSSQQIKWLHSKTNWNYGGDE